MKKKYDPSSFEQLHYERWEKNKYFEKNSEDENYFKFLQKVNNLNKVVTQIGENEKLIELNEMVEKEKKEFVSIEKKLKS